VFKLGDSSMDVRDIASSADEYFIPKMNAILEVPEVARFESSLENSSEDTLLPLGLI
jgi:hypothetical protein